jgi:hypothetical protein
MSVISGTRTIVICQTSGRTPLGYLATRLAEKRWPPPSQSSQQPAEDPIVEGETLFSRSRASAIH